MQSSNKPEKPNKPTAQLQRIKTAAGVYLKRQSFPMPHITDVGQKARQEYVALQLAEGLKKFNEINGCLAALTETDKEQIAPIKRRIELLQDQFQKANQSPTPALNKQIVKEMEAIKKSLKSLVDKRMLKNNENVQALYGIINADLDKLKLHLLLPTQFDDDRIKFAKEIVKKESGANVGFTITNLNNTKFTVKQGKTVGNTLSEAFSSMVLTRIAHVTGGEEDKSKTLIANAFLVVYQPENEDKNLSIEKRCKNNLFAASEWSSGRCFVACNLFGLKKRKKRAGTTQAEDFEDLRKLNAACNLGLENIVTPTALIADFDLHTENFMLKINEDNVPDQYKSQVKALLDNLFNKTLEKSDNVTRSKRLENLIEIIKTIQSMGAVVYFHKIDHDSGFYRYAHSERKVDFSTHQTSFMHLDLEGKTLKTQPTLHITEITGGTAAGLEELLLSNQGIDRLLKISVDSEMQIIYRTTVEFLDLIHDKACVLAANPKEIQAAEFYLLNEFYHHISEKRWPTPSQLAEVDIMQLKNQIVRELEVGTKLKVEDLHVQIYKCLTEKQSENRLTDEERERYAKQIGELKELVEKEKLTATKRKELTTKIEEKTLKLKKDVLIRHLETLPHIQAAGKAKPTKTVAPGKTLG